MKYRKFGGTFVLRLDPKEKICGSLVTLAEAGHITLAKISGLSVMNEFTVGEFNAERKECRCNA